MKPDPDPTASAPFSRAFPAYFTATGQFPGEWLALAALNFLLQANFYRAMAASAPGEFGLLNAALGIIGLLALPLLALQQSLHLFFQRAQDTRLDVLRDSAPTLLESCAWVWGAVCFFLVLVPLPLPALPRFALQLFVLMNVFLALGGVLSATLAGQAGRAKSWRRLVLAAALVRLALGAGLTAYEPVAEVALVVYLAAGFITLAPALRPRDIPFAARVKAGVAALDRDFLRFAAATLSVLGGIYLFTNADRIAVLNWVSAPRTPGEGGGYAGAVNPSTLDAYQAAGLLGRGLLWGTQPLLWLLYAQRSPLAKTTPAALRPLWIYLAVLIGGAIVLSVLSREWTLGKALPFLLPFGPTFAVVMVPLGVLQAFGIFSLASRRYPECFTLGGCGVVYALVLAFFGHRPEIMLPYMFGLALVAVMTVLFVGVVRWGRRQP
jgi:hypothetical protein